MQDSWRMTSQARVKACAEDHEWRSQTGRSTAQKNQPNFYFLPAIPVLAHIAQRICRPKYPNVADFTEDNRKAQVFQITHASFSASKSSESLGVLSSTGVIICPSGPGPGAGAVYE